MSDQDRNLYRQLFSQLRSKLSHGTVLPIPPDKPMTMPLLPTDDEKAVAVSELIRDADFQFLYPFHDWWWPDPPEGYIHPNAYMLLSRMPLCSPTGVMAKYETSSKNLYSTYRNVLLNGPKIDVPSSGSLARQPGDHWNAKHSKALTVSEKPSCPSDEKPGFIKMTTNAGTIACENYLVAHGRDWISELKKEAERNDSNLEDEEPLLNLSLDLSTAMSVMSVDSPQPSDPFFATLMSNNEWENFDVTHHDKKVSVSVKVGAVTRVPVDPDPQWYDGDYLRSLAKRDSWNPPFTTADVFGEKGLLSQRINGLIAAYHIEFKVTVSPETFKKFQPRFDAAVGFRIGPFEFGEDIFSSRAGLPGGVRSTVGEASAGSEALFAHFPPIITGWKHRANSNTSTFEGESTADYPIIIGVTVERIVSDHGDK